MELALTITEMSLSQPQAWTGLYLENGEPESYPQAVPASIFHGRDPTTPFGLMQYNFIV